MQDRLQAPDKTMEGQVAAGGLDMKSDETKPESDRSSIARSLLVTLLETKSDLNKKNSLANSLRDL